MEFPFTDLVDPTSLASVFSVFRQELDEWSFSDWEMRFPESAKPIPKPILPAPLPIEIPSLVPVEIQPQDTPAALLYRGYRPIPPERIFRPFESLRGAELTVMHLNKLIKGKT
jgi:hypothetical protein